MEKLSLPGDMVEEILSRVPAKSLARFRSASKQWNALLKSGNFALKHSAKESLSIMLIDSRVCFVRINLNGIHENVAPSVKVAAQFDIKDPLSSSSQVDIRKVFHCDGLLLCSTMDDRLVVWNPCSGETKWVKPRGGYEEPYSYALGYNNSKSSCKQYKILRVDCPRLEDNSEFEIYDFTSDSWRVGVTNHWWLPFHRRGISVKGNTYWIALNTTPGQLGPSLDDPFFLLSFDFSTEKFQRLSSLPHPFRYKFADLSLIREEQLCLLGANYDKRSSDLHVWVTTSTEPVMSWIKFLTVEDRSESFFDKYRFFGFSFLADVQNNALMCCSYYPFPDDNVLHIVAEDKHIRHVVRQDAYLRRRHLFILNYVPSLAQIQQGTLLGG